VWCASLLAWASIHVLGLLRLVSGFVFRSISRAMDELGTGPQCDPSALDQLKCYLTECIKKYGDEYQYSTDPRLLKIWILYVNFYQLWPHSSRVTSCFLSYFSGVFCDSCCLGGCNWGLSQGLQAAGRETNVLGTCTALWIICIVSMCWGETAGGW